MSKNGYKTFCFETYYQCVSSFKTLCKRQECYGEVSEKSVGYEKEAPKRVSRCHECYNATNTTY